MFDQEWRREFIDRNVQNAFLIPFGVSYLDDAALGIGPGELLLVGGRTGRGKTALATLLATTMASSAKNVAFFALEADRHEIHQRILYRKLSQLYAENYEGKGGPWERFPRFREWVTKGYNQDMRALEEFAISELYASTASLKVFYKQHDYTPQQFKEEITGIGEDSDVIIIDHLHYFDVGRDEFDGLKRTVHLVREICLQFNKPIILLAHLRKADRASKKSLPEIDDFHGHSDIAKVATSILLLSPAPPDRSPGGLFPTYFHLAKMRSAGEIVPFVAVHGFDPKKNAYTENYCLDKSNFNSDPTPIEDASEIPKWARRAIRPTSAFSSSLARKAPPGVFQRGETD